MKTCPNCKELNGEHSTHCWKCNTFLGAPDPYKKVCPKCGEIYSSKAETCEKCGTRLAVYGTEQYQGSSDNSSEGLGCWLYVVSFLIPLVGLIMGCVHLSKGNNDAGKGLLITGVVSMVFWPLLTVLLF